AVHAGLQSMMVMTFERGAALCDFLDEAKLARKYRKLVERMKRYQPEAGGSKQAAALLSLSEIKDAVQLNQDVLAVDGAKRFSAFFGYYMLEAQAKAGDYTRAMQNIRDFWGGMLDLGATTFWEEFDLDEAAGSARIDEWVGDGQKDYHNSTGKECYVGLRRSLCHGWASGPTPWLSRHVLGVRPLVPGGSVLEVKPNLGDLTWVEGSYPTAYGTVLIRHDKQSDGTVISRISAPKEVRIVQD
ncbi:MAG: alpha-L-rhamnosidase C-terminal domain-containing protein, partial [Bacteroidales bacterium]|nr:alpha-L-rhamnosidase C-terminal domain-containing protein [Bacteroidales bacterium]